MGIHAMLKYREKRWRLKIAATCTWILTLDITPKYRTVGGDTRYMQIVDAERLKRLKHYLAFNLIGLKI
ncbi:MAG: hypothetical protein MJE68_29220 [Proteobacteria bacterium]|nr:hypothetical protein [Pseudomonadota bacterium]